ncbi:MAG TPA: hypothetical protein PLJ84_03570 [Bacteroidales bacterium]|nr:hypothetical protein [Bacteroidales bacterium]HPT01651.1 hypothetical protein [Bacteroidales bacterium]
MGLKDSLKKLFKTSKQVGAEKFEDLKEKTADKIDDVVENVAEKAQQATVKAKEIKDDIVEKAEGTLDKIEEKAEKFVDDLELKVRSASKASAEDVKETAAPAQAQPDDQGGNAGTSTGEAKDTAEENAPDIK